MCVCVFSLCFVFLFAAALFSPPSPPHTSPLLAPLLLRCPQRLAKLQAAERERLREELADRKAQREADSVLGTPRHAGHASPSRAAVREGFMAQLEEKERLGSEEKQRERRLDAGMLGFSLAARLLE